MPSAAHPTGSLKHLGEAKTFTPEPGWRPALFARCRSLAGLTLQQPIFSADLAYFGDGHQSENGPLLVLGGPTLTLGNFQQTLFRLHPDSTLTGGHRRGRDGPAPFALRSGPFDLGNLWGSAWTSNWPEPLLFNGGSPECWIIRLPKLWRAEPGSFVELRLGNGAPIGL